MKIANLKTSYNSLPCGIKLAVGEKFDVMGVALYKCYTSINKNAGTYAGDFPKSVLQFIGR